MIDVERFEIEGPMLLRPRIFSDERGRFVETWSERAFTHIIGDIEFVQDNESISRQGVLRGLHLQLDPYAQGKLVRVAYGKVLDICLDIRPGSPTRGRHIRVHLDAASGAQLWIPGGFAHGFVALVENTVFQYKCSAPYVPAAERTILWNDPALGIDWGIPDPIVSPKDQAGIPFNGPWDAPRTA
ncbi:MAG: dTDP-4-dehydrorhamnose 3,5-epimerase [Flavobacteriales bacterium]|nr:dTDP-4-dehydrorhamnose 3,5-epimerase [Flavobacteriales bacterium]